MNKNISKKIRTIIEYSPFYIPILFIYCTFFVFPVISSFHLSLTDWSGLGSYKFIGLKNFIDIFNDKLTYQVAFQTLEYTVILTVVGNIFGITMASIFDLKLPINGIMKAVFFLPYVFNALVVGYIWSYIYEPDAGIINIVLKAIGLGHFAIPWLGNVATVIPAIVFAMVWQYTGANALIYLSGLKSIPKVYYEAAHIDGASDFSIFKHITLPLIAPAITVNVMQAFIGGLKIFDIIFVMTNSGPGYTSASVTTIIYSFAFNKNQYGYATAFGVVLFIIIAFLSIIFTNYFRSKEIEV